MNSPVRISIITPSYNQAAYIDQTIQSVLDQNYPNLEYIIIDGGSTDGTVDIIRRHERHLSFWVSERDRGQAHAINKGLQKATGDLIAYINSDDYYLPNTLARVADGFARNPKADIFHGRCLIVDEQGTKVDERCGNISNYSEILDLWDVWWQRRNFVQPEVFWTRRIEDQIGQFQEHLFWVMDYEYWLRMFRSGAQAHFIDAEFAAFRLQPNQKSTQPERTAEELLRVVHPYIFGSDRLISRAKRLELRAKWTFQVEFQNEVDISIRRKEGRSRRWLRLLLFFVQHPHVLAARSFRHRLFNIRFVNRDSS